MIIIMIIIIIVMIIKIVVLKLSFHNSVFIL